VLYPGHSIHLVAIAMTVSKWEGIAGSLTKHFAFDSAVGLWQCACNCGG